MFVELRRDPREPLVLPVRLADGSPALTRDISASGMYLEIRGNHSIGTILLFEMALEEMRMKLTAEGEVVRVEHSDDRTGIAVRLLSSRLEPTA